MCNEIMSKSPYFKGTVMESKESRKRIAETEKVTKSMKKGSYRPGCEFTTLRIKPVRKTIPHIM